MTITLNAAQIERAIRQLPAVHAVRVVMEEDQSAIAKIHVMAPPSATPKKVVRDIETLLLLKFQLRIDYRKISMVRGRLKDLQPLLLPRLRLADVMADCEREPSQVEVRLTADEEEFMGQASGEDGRCARHLTVMATVRALEAALPRVQIDRAEVATLPLADDETVVVVVHCHDGQDQDRLVGAVLVQSSPLVAAAQATLDAVNRRFFSA